MPQEPSAAQKSIGDVTPKLADLTDKVLFGDVWERAGLSPRDRSLITVTALIALYRSDQLGFHLELAMENGLTKEELSEAITHLAFYAGWPNAMGAAGRLKSILSDAGQPTTRTRSSSS
ncbi:carboxymuconolactone decarboxylase family protein [Streptomyces sp. NPDC091271]|uniref:carboxymuconolactone decarboxylase family protein n=1 Tax=Streptomyces sp. NPDC091271 TaxID=3365980 RepID=UPI003809604E